MNLPPKPKETPLADRNEDLDQEIKAQVEQMHASSACTAIPRVRVQPYLGCFYSHIHASGGVVHIHSVAL